MAPSDLPTRKRGRPRTYTSAKDKQVSSVTQRRSRRQSTRAVHRAQEFDQYYSTTVPLSTDINEPPSTYFPPGELSIATEVEQLLPPLSPDPGPWELSVPDIPPVDIEVSLEPTSDIAHDPTPAMSPDNVQEGTDEADPIPAATESLVQATNPFVVLAPDQSEDVATNTASDIFKLVRLLTDQLQQHHGCCHQCHTQQESEHQMQHTEHLGLGKYIDRIQADGGYPDVLSAATMARREDNLAGQTSADRKREIYTGINSATPDAGPVHLCLTADHEPERPTAVTFDIDSIVGFAHSLAVAKLGVRWNSTQMAVSDLRSGLHLDPLPIQYIGSNGRAHHVRRPVHVIPHYTFGRLVGFEDISLYFLFPQLYRE
ncbi:hypothetical protein N7471_010519 [Penicillium samsonianum]|uniref:uncharacterized protein n=1 Tax=Penicillium samsonianum TaxID=1882272 RepID=UPI0025480F8E|nr:uncharacterized protein N7471_010519 [Penicillium samsonianum]KAJ6126026.1 hypothetical protein N7471_010519 [Penicillium samsonianum]